MPFALRLAASAFMFCLGAEGFRAVKRRPDSEKVIAGVKVVSYDQAGPHVAGQSQDWIVAVDDATTDEQIHHLCHLSHCLAEGHPSEGGVAFFEVRATEEGLETLLKSADGVQFKFVARDRMVYSFPESETEGLIGGTSLLEPGIASSATWGLERIGAGERSSNGRGVHIYVFDSGIRANHIDFGGRVIPEFDTVRDGPSECGGDKSCADDADGHGTHCAGTAGGATYGVAPGAHIYAVKVLDGKYGKHGWMLDALSHVTRKRKSPAVASMSLTTSIKYFGSEELDLQKDAVNKLVEAGVTVVTASGNDGEDACGYMPGLMSTSINVGATTPSDQKWSHSNSGSCVNIWAPGVNIESAHHRSRRAWQIWNGTSMACPHVSGAAALVLQGKPSWSPHKVKRKLLTKALTGEIGGLSSRDRNKLLQVNGL